jgi:hypothetical protein
MSKFDYMRFEGGMDYDFVAHAKKYTKEETIKHCLSEYDWMFEDDSLREPTVEDIKQRQVKYFIRVPDYCAYDTEGGCYTYCSEHAKGSFPVWVIEFEDLRN